MSNANAIRLAIDRASRERDAAGNGLAQVLARHEHARRQMDELRNYAAETQSRWAMPAHEWVSPQVLGSYYQFMERIEQTISLQNDVLAELQRQIDVARQLLIRADVRMGSLKKLREVQRAKEASALSRLEQKQTDEFAAQRVRGKVAFGFSMEQP